MPRPPTPSTALYALIAFIAAALLRLAVGGLADPSVAAAAELAQPAYQPPAPTVEDNPLERLPRCSAFTSVAAQDETKRHLPPEQQQWVAQCKEGGSLTVIYEKNTNSSLRAPIVALAYLTAHIHRSPPPQWVRFYVMQVEPRAGVTTFRIISWQHPPPPAP